MSEIDKYEELEHLHEDEVDDYEEFEQLSGDEIYDLCVQTNFWTWSAQAGVKPIAIDHAKGVYFWDVHGKKYLDFNSMVMCVNIGHEDERVIQAMVKQAYDLPFSGPKMASRPRALLGKMLKTILPEQLDHFLYTLGGADANENAIKLARAYTGKFKILARYRSYHGATYGAVALTGDPRRLAWEPSVMMGVVHFLDPFRYRSTFHKNQPELSDADFARAYLDHLEEVIMYEGADSIAAIIIETVTGTNGIIIPPDGYLEGLREICTRNKIVMICDEVMSGFGRTGEWFAFNHWGVVPDIVTMAKGLTSGYAPMGAVAMRKEIAQGFNNRIFQGGLTYNGHAICLAAAYAVIKVMKQDHLISQSKKLGHLLCALLAQLKEKHACVGDVRSLGLFGVIEVVKDQDTREPEAPYGGTSPVMEKMRKFMLEQGLFIYTHWHTILIVPPLIITEEQLLEGIEIIDQALSIADSELENNL